MECILYKFIKVKKITNLQQCMGQPFKLHIKKNIFNLSWLYKKWLATCLTQAPLIVSAGGLFFLVLN